MTVTHYAAKFTDGSGREFVGEVYWDKLHQGEFQVSICPLISPSVADYPIWQVARRYAGQSRREVMLALVEKLRGKAAELKLTLMSERETEFAPKE